LEFFALSAYGFWRIRGQGIEACGHDKVIDNKLHLNQDSKIDQ